MIENKTIDDFNKSAELHRNTVLAKEMCEAEKYEQACKYALNADPNDPAILFCHGLMYQYGFNVKQNEEKAIKLFHQSAGQGYAHSQFSLGAIYEKGIGVIKDEVEAVKWYCLAAKQNNIGSQLNLSVMYKDGRGIKRDEDEAIRLCRLSAEQGSPGGQFNLGLMYLNGIGVIKDEVEAVKWYHLAARQGLPYGQFHLGMAYDFGCGAEKNAIEAVKWYHLAAKQGLVHSQFHLGLMYHNGEGVEKDYVEANKWFLLAAKQDHVRGQFNLGVAYHLGHGMTIDYVEAVKWYRLTADQKHSSGQYNLGWMYEFGLGVEKDEMEAVKLYHLSAEQDSLEAECHLALMYKCGCGVEKDKDAANRWLMKAMEQGDSPSIYNELIQMKDSYESEGDIECSNEAYEILHRLISKYAPPTSPTLIYTILGEQLKNRIKEANHNTFSKEMLNATKMLKKACLNLLEYLSNHPKKGYLWHYTTQTVLDKISSTRSLWLHPACYQNDPDEGCFLYNALMSNKPDQKDINEHSHYNVFRELYDATQLDERLKDSHASQQNDNSYASRLTLIASLSQAKDSLQMWHSSYAELCHGCAIGIPYAQFEDKECGNSLPTGIAQFMQSCDTPFIKGKQDVLKSNEGFVASPKQEPIKVDESSCQTKTEHTPIPLNMLGLFKVLYLPNEGEKEDVMDDSEGIKLFNCIKEALSELFKVTKDIQPLWIRDFLFPLAHLIKSKDYQHEKEYRLMRWLDHTSEQERIYFYDTPQLHIETEPFLFDVTASESCKNRICLGPAVSAIDRRKKQHLFEYKTKMRFPFEKSKVNYRDTKST